MLVGYIPLFLEQAPILPTPRFLWEILKPLLFWENLKNSTPLPLSNNDNPIRWLENVNKVSNNGISTRSNWWIFAKIKLKDIRRNCRGAFDWCHSKSFKKSIDEKHSEKYESSNWWNVLSSIAKMMQIPPLEGEEHVQHKIKEEESDQSKDDERSKCQLDTGNRLAAWYG